MGGLGGCLSDPQGAAERVDELMDPYALVNRKHCKHDKLSRTRGGEKEERRFTTSLKRVTIKSDGIYKGLGGGVREVVVVGGGSMTSPVTAGAAQPYMQTHVLSDSAIKPLTRAAITASPSAAVSDRPPAFLPPFTTFTFLRTSCTADSETTGSERLKGIL